MISIVMTHTKTVQRKKEKEYNPVIIIPKKILLQYMGKNYKKICESPVWNMQKNIVFNETGGCPKT